MTTALITGGTCGIGLGFARRLAADGHDLVLVARNASRLDKTAADLHDHYGVRTDTLAADLTTPDGCARVEEYLACQPVDILVNNAGHSLPQPYPRSPLADEERMLNLLVRAPLRLTHAALPGMTARRRGAILNIASVAGLLPAGTYGAAKAWLIHFSESLRHDLTPHGIRVLAVCPGFTRTTGASHIDTVRACIWLTVDQVVDQAMKDLRRNKPRSIAGRHFQLYAAAAHHAPRRLAARMARTRTRTPKRHLGRRRAPNDTSSPSKHRSTPSVLLHCSLTTANGAPTVDGLVVSSVSRTGVSEEDRNTFDAARWLMPSLPPELIAEALQLPPTPDSAAMS